MGRLYIFAFNPPQYLLCIGAFAWSYQVSLQAKINHHFLGGNDVSDSHNIRRHFSLLASYLFLVAD